MGWTIDCVVVGPIQCNCYILADSISRQAYLIDPGAESKELLSHLKRKQWDLQGMLITHAHIDHVGGIEMIRADFPATVYFHTADRFLYENLAMQADLFGATPQMLQATQPQVGSGAVEHDQQFPFGNRQICVLHTPGHTPGSVCFYASGDQPVVFTGDTLFEGSIGRTDLWGGSFEQIIQSIHGRLLTLEDRVQVLPGHGPATTIGRERRHNPFLLSY